MSKGLEALQDLSKMVFIYGGVEQYKIIEKELKDKEEQDKILKIIKNKVWPMIGFEILTDGKSKSYRVICDTYRMDKILTQQEYDLLQEVLL